MAAEDRNARPRAALRSVLPGIGWPAIVSPAGATSLALLMQFGESERLPPAELRARQFAQLRRLLGHAQATVPYWSATLAAAGLDASVPLTEAVWRRLPLLTRRHLQEQGEGLKSSRIPAAHGRVGPLATSGSTATPVVVWRTELVNTFWYAITLRDHLWHGRDFSARLAVIRHNDSPRAQYPKGISAPTWGRASAMLYRTGPSHLLSIRTDIDKQIEWLQRIRPDYLLTYPTNLREIAEACRREGQPLPGLRGVMTVSETLDPELRALTREALGVPVTDAYSCQEVGYLALQCPASDCYHVQAETVLLEVLDADGAPVPPGGSGRIVVSQLHNFAMPMVRYELGDYAEVGEGCPCGRTLPVLRRILGRQRHRVRHPGGRVAWPLFGSTPFLDIAPIVQFQIVQHALDDVEMRAVVRAPPTSEQEARLRQAVQQALDGPLPVRFTWVDEIPRSASGKYEVFVSRVGD